MLYNETKKLYRGKYQYRIVLVCPGVHVFRGNDLDQTFVRLSKIAAEPSEQYLRSLEQRHIDYLFDVYSILQTLTDYTVRVETPWLSVYTNDYADILRLKNLGSDRVKTIYVPKTEINDGEVVSTLPYDYKVTINSSKEGYDSFVKWAQDFDTIRLTKSCEVFLKHGSHFRRTLYFYVKGDKTLTMSRLHLGQLIRKVERIVHREESI